MVSKAVQHSLASQSVSLSLPARYGVSKNSDAIWRITYQSSKQNIHASCVRAQSMEFTKSVDRRCTRKVELLRTEGKHDRSDLKDCIGLTITDERSYLRGTRGLRLEARTSAKTARDTSSWNPINTLRLRRTPAVKVKDYGNDIGQTSSAH
jgi:hypothetical protein